jgi:hypothetical protein
LPGVALAKILPHADQSQQWKAAAFDQRQHVDAVAGAAALHQQDTASAAEIGPGEQCHPLLLGGQRDRLGSGIGERAVDQDPVGGIRHTSELGDIVAAQQVVEIVLPSSRRAAVLIHAAILR